MSTDNKDEDKTIIQTSLKGVKTSQKGDRSKRIGTASATLADLSGSGLSGRSSPVNKEEVSVPTLVIFTSDHKGEKFPLSNGKSLQVGREKVDIVISHRSVSALHCTFSNQDGITFLIENGSTNGTFLNRQRLRPHRRVIVDEDDEIYIGQVKVCVLMPKSKGTSHEDFPSPPLREQTMAKAQQSPSQSTEDLLGQDQNDITLTRQAPKEGASRERIRNYWGKRRGQNQVSIGKNRKSPSEGIPLAGPFFRFWALAGDFLFNDFIVALLFHFQFSLDIIEGLKKDWLQEINVTLGELLKMNNPVDLLVIPLLIFGLFRLLCIVLFGVSLAQGLMGFRGMYGFIWNRLGGVIRAFWELLLGGFLIFDIPLLWKKRSVKELLSRTAIINGPRILRLFSSVTLIPLMMALPLASDFILQWDYHKGFVVTPYNVPSLPSKEKKAEENLFFDFTSRSFRVSSSPIVDKDRFLFLTGYNITSKNKSKRFRRRIALFDRKLNRPAYLTVYSRNKLEKAFSRAFSNDLALETQYSKAFALFPGLKISDVLLMTGPRKMIPIGNKVEELLKMSFALNTSSVIGHIISGNFSINKMARLRQFFIEEFQLTPQSQIQTVKLNQHRFLKINPEPLNTATERLTQVYFIPIDTFRGPIYELTYFNRDGGELVGLKLLQYLFTGGRFYFDRPLLPFSPPSEEDLSKVTFGQCIDYLFPSKIDDLKKAIVYKRYLNYLDEVLLFHAHREVPKSQKEAERTFLLEELSSLIEMEGLVMRRWPELEKHLMPKGLQYQLNRLKDNEFK